MRSRPIRVLESFPEPRVTTNPYITQLARALDADDGIELITYRPLFALFGLYDVFHVHWPDNLVGGHKRIGRLGRRVHASLLCLRLLLTRTPVVRTWHNLERPEHLGRFDHVVMDWIDRLTTTRIRLNDVTESAGHDVKTILHGHYRDWFDGMPAAPRDPRRLVFAGLVRRYKGVDALVSSFVGVDDPDLTLTVAGKSSPADAAALAEIAAGDPRVSFDLRYLGEEDLVTTITGASLVALPYRRLHNSGAVLAALSLDRPVLVPDTDSTRSLAAEVGEEWIIRYQGELTPEALAEGLQRASRLPDGRRPDLSGRDWHDVGAAHRRVFEHALVRRRG